MLPMWKLKRELRRARMQLTQIPSQLFNPIIRRAHDWRKNKQTVLTSGDVPLGDNVCILLLFQPNGLGNSVFYTLDHLISNGFSPFVVSNAPLSDEDRTRLQRYAWRVMQRPNFGYDFGGYRDAILHMLDERIWPENLLVINDSIWFPIFEDSQILSDIRTRHEDMFGLVLSDRPDAPHRTHLQSYFFSFKKRLVASETFHTFWRNLPISNNKVFVVHKCEMQLTNAFRKAGFTIGQLHEFSDVQKALKGLDEGSLRRIMSYQTQVDTSNAKHLEPLLGSQERNDAWRAEVDRLIEDKRIGKYFLIAHPLVLVGALRLPILKKDRQPMYRLQRSELFDCGLGDDLAPIIRDEIRSWDIN